MGRVLKVKRLLKAINIKHNSVQLENVKYFATAFKSAETVQDEDYQYWQKSKVPTLHFQPSLPRLPIPELPNTCKRYLRAQRPIVSDNEYNKTEAFVKKFESKEGQELQNMLKDIDSKNKHTSYISGPWFDMYLRDRTSLPINYNPFMVFVNDKRPEYNKQLIRSTNLLISSLRFMKSLNANLLEPEVFHMNPKKSDTQLFRTVTGALPSFISWYGAYMFKAFPLDMSQYSNLFNTTRIPNHEKDILYHDSSQKHVLVMKGGRFYVFDVIDKDGNIISPEIILGCLKYICEIKNPPAEHPVGVLTTENRDKWATCRQHLESIGNGDTLKLIDGSIFNLALDDTNEFSNREILTNLTRQFLHSDGVNRWFDKSFSLIVASDGVAGINFEHSWGDGVAVLRYFQDIYKDSTEKPFVHPDSKHKGDPETLVRELEFKLDDKAKSMINEAKSEYSKTCSSLGVNVMEFKKLGRSFCKTKDISPDAVMQLAFQVGYDQLAQKQVATYESCSTAAFKHGRTECIRPCTLETTSFCKMLRNPSADTGELRKMMDECSKVHGNLVKEAAMGQGFDRHLFALRRLAEADGKKLDIFMDPAYSLMNHNILSTSTLSSNTVLMGGFGPVVKNGFGVGYSVWKDRVGTVVTNYNGHSDGTGYVNCLESGLKKLYDILNKH